MLSPLTNSLTAAAGQPLAPEGAPGIAGRRPSPPRASGAGLLPAVAAAASAAARAASKARTASSPPRALPSAAGYAKAAPVAASKSTKSTSAAKSASTSKSTSKSTSTAAKPGPLAFLDDPKLSVEEKLLKLLAYLNDKWNKDLDQKMKELKTGGGTAARSASTAASSTQSKSSGISGALGSVVSLAKQVMPQVGIGLDLLQSPLVRSTLSSVSGPALAALATATGFPELAPLALKYGPEIVDAAAGLAGSATGSSGPKPSSGGTSTPSSSSGSSAGAIGSDRDAQLKLMEIQRIMDQQKEMFSMTSNLLRTGHETRMAVIQNLR